jgi:voltage-gated potassium channel
MIRRMSNSLLLVALLLLAVTEPFFPGETFGHAVYLVMITVVLIAAVWATSRHRSLFVAGLALAVPTFAAAWMHHFLHTRWLSAVFLLLAAAFFGFTAVVVLRQALGGAAVTADTVAGAICFYLLLGVIWAIIFSLVEVAHPGSFLDGGRPLNSSTTGPRSLVPSLLYLSLVTLSTLGYGDILPITPTARMLAALEAIIGPLYLAVLIARLVGLHASRSRPGA